MTALQHQVGQTLWSGLETKGMKEAKCSLLLQEDAAFEPKIKALPKQRVLVYQDKGFHPNSSTSASPTNGANNSPANNNNNSISNFNSNNNHRRCTKRFVFLALQSKR